MNKNTINKAFEKYFDQIIWKIEVDSAHRLIAVETRADESTLPSFHLLDFEGNSLGQAFQPGEKEWTMDSVQNGMLILKQLGDNAPVKEGVKVVGYIAEKNKLEETWGDYAYTLVDTYRGYLALRHRMLSHGQSSLLCLDTWQIISQVAVENLSFPENHVSFPISYTSCPPFLSNEDVEGQLWLNSIGENYLWSYHIRRNNAFDLVLGISDRYELISREIVLSGIPKMVPQPYFQVGRQLFFLSYNKREIVAYLV